MVGFNADDARDTDRSYLSPEIVNQRLQTIEAMALREGERVLDAGCGSGLLSELISLRVGKSGQVTGVDLSEDMLALARNRCEALGNVTLKRGSVTGLDLESGSFDVASCIQTLLYVENTMAALGELYRVLKSRGRVAILETDWRGAVLNSPDPATTRKVLDAWDAAVANPGLPPRLTQMLLEAGFSAIRVRAIPVMNAAYNENGFSVGMLKYMSRNAVRQGVLDDDEASQWLKRIFDLRQQQAYFFCVNRFLFTAVK